MWTSNQQNMWYVEDSSDYLEKICCDFITGVMEIGLGQLPQNSSFGKGLARLVFEMV